MHDQEQFDHLWQSRINQERDLGEYKPGQNLRIDKALQELPQGQRLLDIGCGDGTFLAKAKDGFREAFGIDIAETAVALAIKRGVKATALNMNSGNLQFQDDFFDAITILSTFQYFYDPDGVLKECHRIIRDEGVLLMSIPNMRTFWRVGRLLFSGRFPRVSKDMIGYDGGTLHYFCFHDMQELLSRNGFRIDWAHGIYPIPIFLSNLSDKAWMGKIKREFFCAEIFIKAVKIPS